MPSSPGPTAYKRTLQRFFYRGISLEPQDALAEGKMAWARNMRSYQEGTMEVRYGIDTESAGAIGAGPVHTIARLNDTTSHATTPARRFIGTGTAVFQGIPGAGTYASVDTGYSGDPLTYVAAHPFNSPRPFLYIADQSRMRKIDTELTNYSWGIGQPTDPPAAQLAKPELAYLDPVRDTHWTSYGGTTTPAAPTLLTPIDRVNTTIDTIVYDDAAPGMASVILDDFQNVTPGANLDIAGAEQVIVHSIHPAVSSNTIGTILYDSGSSGLCTIQPDGGFWSGQIEAPLQAELEKRYQELGIPVPPRITLSRPIDFPVDSLVVLDNGVDPAETVRILSVAVGPDGVQSFRCSTTATYAAGDSITGAASFRAYFTTTRAAADAVVQQAYQVTVTPPDATTTVVGGVQGPITGAPKDWGQVGDRALQPDDIIRLGIKISLMGYVQSVRLAIDVQALSASPSPSNEFLQDYYFFEWRESDLITAIQATSEIATGLVADAQGDAVERGETAAFYQNQFGYGQTGSLGTGYVGLRNRVRARAGLSPLNIAGSGGGIATPGGYTQGGGLSGQPTGRTAIPRDGAPQVGGGVSRQLWLGNNVWMTLECRVSDLVRVGTDQTATLGTMFNAAVWAQILGTDQGVTVEVSDVYVIGTYGPDVDQTLPPYVYRYSYRSTETGERSNLSPPTRAGVTPRRGAVQLEATPSPDAQCDVIDWWRFGGTLAQWVHVGTSLNDPAASPAVNPFVDDRADEAIDGGETPRTDLFQPWPTTDLPRKGTCNVAGTAVEWVSGDTFNTSWAADSLIIVNGIPTQLYCSPSSTTRLEVTENCGEGTGVPFTIPGPTLKAQSLPVVFGGPINNVWFHFGLGDPSNPGNLHWSNSNDPDSASDANVLTCTSASEPLMNGWIDDGIPYVFSTKRLYRLLPVFGDLATFQTVETACTRGLWSRWGFVPSPEGGAYFVRPDGIWYTRGGSDAVSITAEDLAPLFDQDGTGTYAIRNLNPIDFTDVNRLRLAIIDHLLYFDYVDNTGEGHTLVYDRITKAWTPDAYLETGSPSVPTGVTVRLSEPGQEIHNHLLALEDNLLYEYSSTKVTDVETDVNWAIWTPWAHGEDPRAWKQWGDAILDFNPAGSVDGIEVTPVIDNGNVALDTRIIGAGGAVRDTFLVEVGIASDELGDGVWSRNCGLLIEGAVQPCDEQRPIFYLWEPSHLWKGISVARRATDWEDLGYRGAKFVQGIVIRANTFGVNKTINVQYDGPNDAPQTALTLTLNHDGEQTVAYPLAAAGWTPFIAELVRLQGGDAIDWVLLDWRWVFEPAPELATQWETQYTTFDFPGFLHVFDGIVALQSTASVNWFIEYQDGDSATYNIPSSAGAYLRTRVITQAQKGKAVRFRWTSPAPFRLFKRDCSVRVQGWGVPGGYMLMNPFGGPHREDGAGI